MIPSFRIRSASQNGPWIPQFPPSSLLSLIVCLQRMRVESRGCLWEGRLFTLWKTYCTCLFTVYLYTSGLCRCVLRAGVSSGLLRQPGAEVDGPEQPGHGGDWAGPSPLSAGPSRLPKPHRHRGTETRPHRLRSPQPQDRILSGGEVRWHLCRDNDVTGQILQQYDFVWAAVSMQQY